MSKTKSQNSSKRKIIFPVVIIILLFLGIGLGMSYFKNNLFTVMKVPDFELTDQNRKKISLYSSEEKTSVL